MEVELLAQEFGKNWELLNVLYNRDYYLTELADELGINKSVLPKKARDLIRAGLIKYDRRPEGKTERKYFVLTEDAKKIIEFFLKFKSSQQIKKKDKNIIDKRKIDYCFNAFDTSFSLKTREVFASYIPDLCYRFDIWNDTGVKEKLKEKLNNPSFFSDEVGEKIFTGFLSIFEKGIQKDDDFTLWVSENLYSILKTKAEDNTLSEPLRKKYIDILRKLFQGKVKQEEILTVCKKIIFDSNIDIESPIFRSARNIILQVPKRALHEKLYYETLDFFIKKAKSSNKTEKERAGLLILEFMRNLPDA